MGPRWPGSNRPLSGRLWRCCVALGLVALLGACATRERAEAIYMQQHRTTVALTESILAAETENEALADRLYLTESELGDACASLREAGYRKFSGDELDGALEWAIFRSLDTCADKAADVERLLWRIDPETASYFLNDPGDAPDRAPSIAANQRRDE